MQEGKADKKAVTANKQRFCFLFLLGGSNETPEAMRMGEPDYTRKG